MDGLRCNLVCLKFYHNFKVTIIFNYKLFYEKYYGNITHNNNYKTKVNNNFIIKVLNIYIYIYEYLEFPSVIRVFFIEFKF